MTTAVLLTGAAMDPIGIAPAVPVVLAAAAASDQAVQLPPAPVVATDSPAPPQPAAPAGSPPPPESSVPPAPTDSPSTAEPTTPPASPGSDRTDIVVEGQTRAPPEDPLQAVNVKSFEVTQAVDTAIVRPVAMTYQRTLPLPLRTGFSNFLNNLREPAVFINYMLQLKPGKAAETAGRFAINTTIGVGGLFDMAKRKPFKLPRRVNGFAYTMGYYGVKPGAFLFLPLVGPTTVRDLIGDTLDRAVVPLTFGSPFNQPVYSITTGTLSSLDQRAEFDHKLEKLHSADNAYKASREDYLRSRQAAIDELHGKTPSAEPAAGVVAPAVEPTAPAVAPVAPAPAVSPDQPASQPEE